MNTDFSKKTKSKYNRLRILLIVVMCLVSLAPLTIITFVSYFEYEEVFLAEMTHQVNRRISNIKQSVEFFISERLAAVMFLINDNSYEELSNNKRLTTLLSNLKESFGGFVDIGLIDPNGVHKSYVGPYELSGINYKGQLWFQEVILQDVYVSNVFMGFRKFPHFVIAVKHDHRDGKFCILRATLNTDILNKKIHSLDFGSEGDVFLINHEGILQTPSRQYGNVLEKIKISVPPYSQNTVIKTEYNDEGIPYIFGYAYIENSPFILVVTKSSEDFLSNLLVVRNNHFWFLAISIIIIVIVILRSTFYMVNRLIIADQKQAKALHSIEYTNKMASIGRLAAGVAHEINNPLAIINEKAGLMKDIATLKPKFEYKEKILEVVDSILRSVNRCSTITHRLLGFAKRMEVNVEKIDLELLLKEVCGFLEKEAALRNISINYNIAKDLPSIESDRGQLQQVFLNIVTNAFYAVKDNNGKIDIIAEKIGTDKISITVTDNGVGISEENLDHIFEPFFTTKGEYGTGLGLSITYGIIQKLGGETKVKSKIGKGTSLIVILPLKSKIS